jgi:hypothetical protein
MLSIMICGNGMAAEKGGTRFVGQWESDLISIPPHLRYYGGYGGNSFYKIVLEITHNSGNQYYISAKEMTPSDSDVLKNLGGIAAVYKNGMLEVDGALITMDEKTGNINLGGKDFIKLTEEVRRATEERRAAEERKATEERRVAEERRAAEEHRAAEEQRKAAEERRAAEERKAAEERRAAETRRASQEEAMHKAGFIALSEHTMPLADAKTYCEQQGGRLPRINNSSSWNGSGIVPIDGIGSGDVGFRARNPGLAGLPNALYWTGTEDGRGGQWIIDHKRVGGTNITLSRSRQDNKNRVICVPK